MKNMHFIFLFFIFACNSSEQKKSIIQPSVEEIPAIYKGNMSIYGKSNTRKRVVQFFDSLGFSKAHLCFLDTNYLSSMSLYMPFIESYNHQGLKFYYHFCTNCEFPLIIENLKNHTEGLEKKPSLSNRKDFLDVNLKPLIFKNNTKFTYTIFQYWEIADAPFLFLKMKEMYQNLLKVQDSISVDLYFVNTDNLEDYHWTSENWKAKKRSMTFFKIYKNYILKDMKQIKN